MTHQLLLRTFVKGLAAFCLTGFFSTGNLQAQYCASSFANPTYEHLTNVTFGGISNTTGGIGGYNDYTSQVANVTTGTVETISVTILADIDEYIYAFIDWDQNNVLNDPGEVYVIASLTASPGPHTLSITIPLTALPGNTRMRVMVDYANGSPNPCRVATWGEVEDYTVNVLSQPCVAPPTAGSAVTSNSNPCPNIPFVLSLQGASGGIGMTYQWESSPDNLAWTPIPGATSATYNTSATSSTYYRCILTCSGQNSTSVETFVQVASFLTCYCTPTTVFGCGVDYIANVTLGSINNTTTCGSTYNDFTNLQTTLFVGSSYTLSVTTDGDDEGVGVWIDYNQNGVFETTEFVLSGYTGNQPETYTTTLVVPQGVPTGPTRMRVRCKYAGTLFDNEACSNSISFGETEDYLVIVAPLPQNDVGVVSIMNPSLPACNLSDTLKVEIGTIGAQALTTGSLNIQVNGGTPAVIPFTTNISGNQTTVITAGFFSFNDGDALKVWTSNPNGIQDSFAFNDTLQYTLYQALSGVYTIGGVNPDYATLNTALDTLYLRGICSDVFFDIRTGTYAEHLNLVEYPGAGTNGRVTFRSESGVASDAVMSYSPLGSLDNYHIRFNGGDYYTFSTMTLRFNNATYSNMVVIQGGSDSNIVDGCIIIGDTMVFSDNFEKMIFLSTVNNDKNNIFRNNFIRGGSRTFSLAGTGLLSLEEGTRIENNVVRDFYTGGIILFNQSNPSVIGNDVASDKPNANFFKIYLQGAANGVNVSGNHIRGGNGGFGINLDNCHGNQNHPGIVSNNFVYMGDTIGVTNSHGIFMQNATSMIDVYHNSLSLTSPTASSSGVRMQTGANNNINIVNNNIAHSGNGLGIYMEASYNVNTVNHNNIFASTIGTVGTSSYTSLGNWQSSTGFDANSYSVDPNFNGDDLHTCRVELDNSGTPVGVTDDFDGDLRTTNTPDIGADEFIGAAPINLGPDTMVCSGTPVGFGVEYIQGADYVWQPFQDTTASITATLPGQYILTVTSACGTQTDTVVLNNVPIPTATFSTTTNFFTVITNNGSTNGTSYHWDFGDGNTSTEFSPSHVYGNNGPFIITLTVYNECGDSAQYTRQVNITAQHVGLEEYEQGSMSVFPNPTNGPTTIKLNYAGNGDVLIRIEDIAGRVVWMQQTVATGSEMLIPVDVTSMAPGTYLVRIKAGEYEAVQKLIRK